MYLSKNLIYLKEKNNISRYKLAKKLDMNESVLRTIENGTSKNPRINTILKLSLYFNVSLDDIINKDLKEMF